MKKSLFCFLYLCFCWYTMGAWADVAIEDGVYSISCQRGEGYVALGAYHDMSPYICYVTDGSALTEDAYWVVTNTKSGVTFRNEASGQYIIFTTGRVDAYYKGMTIADAAPEDQSHLWSVRKNDDGSVSINSNNSPNHYWNLRLGEGLVGTYSGSNGGADNEHYFFTKKGASPDNPDTPDTPTTSRTSFPDAFHVFLTDGRLEAYPLSIVKSHSEAGGKLVIETTIGKTYSYNLTDVASTSETAPTDFPTFESFKFNNKFNDQLFTDADGEMVGDTVYVTIAAIGKRLTPSFKLPDGEDVEVYVDNVRQESKVTRLRFDKDIYYVVTRPGYQMLLPETSSDQKGSETYSMQPYGRIIRVNVNWLTDQAKVPAIYINTVDRLPITSKTEYKIATISIDGQSIFPSMDLTYVQIKGRGNTSWSSDAYSKNPYRLKFDSKVKPLGMTKGKSWVLLANRIGGSMMTNAIGMKAANLMGAAAANHIVPVDLYLNGEYRGSYNLTEKVGLSNNSVDLEDETAAALLELDSYYDEPEGQKFRTTPYDLPINVKAPDFTEDETTLTLDIVKNSFNSFVKTLYQGRDITKHVDLEQLVRFLMVDELTLNYEFYHPKSTFCYRESFESDTSKYVFGPVWDLDWCFGYEHNRNYFKREATANYWKDQTSMEVIQFVRDLRFKYAPLGELYEKLWKEFMDNDLQELMEYCQDYYDFAHNSFDHNRSVWGDWTDYEQQAKEAASWLEARTQKIYEDIINDVRPDTPEPEIAINFDNDKLYTLTCRRGALVLSEDYTKLQAGQSRPDAPEEDYKFAIIHIGDYNYLYSPVLKKYMTVVGEDGRFTDEGLGSVIGFDISHADGEYEYMITADGTKWFNNNTKTIVINTWHTPDDGDRWFIEEAGDFDPTEALALADEYLMAVTRNVVFNNKVIATDVVKLPSGAEIPAPPASWSNLLVDIEAPVDMPLIAFDDETINYNAVWHGPFQFSQTEENAKWYNMTIRSSYYVGKDVTEPYYPIEYDEDALASHDYQWAFGGDPYHVKLYNRSTGFSQTLTKDDDMAVMREGDYTWDILANSDGFVLRIPDTDYSCINQLGGKSGPLKFWVDQNSLKDNGSTFRVEEVIEEVETSAIIIANNYTRYYGDDNPSFSYTTQGGAVEGVPEITCEADATSTIGQYPIVITKGSITNENITLVNGTLTIKPAPLTIKAETYTKKQGEQNPEFTLTYEGFKNDETADVLTRKPSITTAAMASSAPGNYPVTLSGAKADNYTISYVNGTLVVSEADPLTVVAKDITRVYGEPNPDFEYTTEGATMEGQPRISCDATINSPVGTYDIVIKKGSVKNYNDKYVNGTLTILPAPLTIKAGTYTKKQGEQNPDFTLTYEGFKNNETASVLTKQPTVTTTATKNSEPGEYPVTISGAEAQNYNMNYEDGILFVYEADKLLVIANSYTRVYGDPNPAFEYTTSGTSIVGEPSISCSATINSPVGIYPIVIEKGSVQNFNDEYRNGTLTIIPAPLTITADTYTKKQGEQNPEFTLNYEGFKNNETADVLTTLPSATTDAVESSAPGTYPVTLSGAEAKNYDITYVNGTLVISEADALMVLAKNVERYYGDPNPIFEYTTEGATMVGTPDISCTATIDSPVGTYDIVISKGSVKNYNDKYVKGTLTIKKAPLTVTANDLTMEQGDVVPQLTLTYDGFKNGETAKVLKKQPMATTNATSESPAGSYQILVSGGEADNYDITRVNGTLTITVPVGIYAARDQLLKGRDVYDLTGRKLNRITRRGVYVVNGKRITVK